MEGYTKEKEQQFKKFLIIFKEEIAKADTIMVTGHFDPDGDALGSSIAMAEYLRELGKKVTHVMDKPAKEFEYIQGFEKIVPAEEGLKNEYDLAIYMDAGNIWKFKHVEGLKSKRTMCIDHHIGAVQFTDVAYIDDTKASNSEIVYDILKEMGYEISKEIMESLITGCITDTGGFRYPDTSVTSFKMGEEAIRKGVKLYRIFDSAIYNTSKKRFVLEQFAMQRLTFFYDGKIAFNYLDRDDKVYTTATPHDSSEIVNMARGIEGVELSILLRETEDGKTLGSIRGKNSVEYLYCANITKEFGGGGHRGSGSFILPGRPLENKEKVVSVAMQKMKEMKEEYDRTHKH